MKLEELLKHFTEYCNVRITNLKARKVDDFKYYQKIPKDLLSIDVVSWSYSTTINQLFAFYE